MPAALPSLRSRLRCCSAARIRVICDDPDQSFLLTSSGGDPLGDRIEPAYPGKIVGMTISVAGSAHHEITTSTSLYANRE